MSRILVTGATGFLGTHLVDLLLARGAGELRLFSRGADQSQRNSGTELLSGSITDPEAVRAAVEGCEQIYHLAGAVSRDPKEGRGLYEVHVGGTKVLLDAAKKAGVKRVVLLSSSGTVGVSRSADRVATEEQPCPIELLGRWPYYLSKVYQEQLALRFSKEQGLPVVALNPSLLLGPGDERLSSTVDVLRFLNRRIPAVPPGGLSFVDARDVAQAAVAAMEQGRPGERYLLGAANWSFRTFFERLERASKVSAPKLRLPGPLAAWSARALDAWHRAAGTETPVDPVEVEMASHFWYIDSSKAERELGFNPRDPGQTLQDTVRFIRERILRLSPWNEPARP